MTKEEAKEIIESECYVFNPLNFDRTTRINTALDVAVEALEQEPCNDAISRRAVLDTLDKMDSVLDENRTVEAYKELLTACYKDLPSVIPTRKQMEWINIKKQLPPIGLDVLICDIDGDIYLTHRTEHVGYNIWSFYDESVNRIKDVIAWQPLPAPYRAESEDKE